MDNYEFTSQLAQMGQLEQVTNLSSLFEQFLRVQEFGNASSLIGRRVRYTPEGSSVSREGVVSGARLDDGEVKLVVGGDLVPLSAVTEVGDVVDGLS
jgi:flagellar hook assembly protein FlgD